MNLKIKTKLMLLVSLFLFGFIGFAFIAMNTIDIIKVNGDIYKNIIQGKDLMADILPPPEYIIETYLSTMQLLGETDKTKIGEIRQALKGLKSDYTDRHHHWIKELEHSSIKTMLIVDSYEPASNFFRILETEFLPAIDSGNNEKAKELAYGSLKKEYQDHRTKIDKLVKMANRWCTDNESKAELIIQERNFALLSVGFIIMGTCVIFALFLIRSITRPLMQTIALAQKLSTGDLSVKIEVDRNDETGQLLFAMKNMTSKLYEKMHDIVQKLTNASATLLTASKELSVVSQETVDSATEMNTQTEAVVTASDRISKHVETVAVAAEKSGYSVSSIAGVTEEMSVIFSDLVRSSRKTFENVSVVSESSAEISVGILQIAKSIEEMTSSLNQVSQNTSTANLISQNANQRTEMVDLKMKILSDASRQIGKVVKVIKDIADKTNMLALNATIEAAGAGEAGKGFAVVAGEVKELANQSTEATEEIAHQIDQIQRSTNEAVTEIREISKIINNIANANQTIASAVEEQTSTANKISKTIAQNATMVKNIAGNANESANLVNSSVKTIEETSKTVKEVAEHIQNLVNSINNVAKSAGESSSEVKKISKNIHSISIASKNTSAGATQTSTSAEELTQIALALSEIVKQFKFA